MRKTCPFHDFFLCNWTYRKGRLMFEKPPPPIEELISGWQYRYLWKQNLKFQVFWLLWLGHKLLDLITCQWDVHTWCLGRKNQNFVFSQSFLIAVLWQPYLKLFWNMNHYTKIQIRQSTYNMIRWFAGPMGQRTHRPSVWCSKYYFF